MMKKHNTYTQFRAMALTRSGLQILLGLCFLYPSYAHAQSLPNDFAKEQVPPSFPEGDETKKETEVKAIDDVVADADQNKTPEQPQEEKLVPATAMGVGAKTETSKPEDITNKSSADMPPADVLDNFDPVVTDAEMAEALPDIDDSMMIGLDDPLVGPNSPALMMDVKEIEEKSPEELQEEIRSEAFDAAITGLFPLDEDQIGKLLKKYDGVQKATATPPYPDPKPEISIQNLSLDPGVAPAVIKTALGNVSTLNILDVTGSPWPIQDVTWAGDFEVIEPEKGGHIIRITPMSHFAKGNMVIRMLTLKTPIIVTLETSRDVVQYRVDARISEYGPFAKTSLVRGGKSLVAGTSEQTAILDGTPSAGMIKLNVSGVDGRTTVYTDGASTYVRTPLTLLSPSWQSSMSSADGMNVYVLSSAPVLLLSDDGDFQRATITEKEDLLDE